MYCIRLSPRDIGEIQWSRPDDYGSDSPSIKAWRGIVTMKAIDAFHALLGKETEKQTIACLLASLKPSEGTRQRTRRL
jgi:hypothetical protein